MLPTGTQAPRELRGKSRAVAVRCAPASHVVSRLSGHAAERDKAGHACRVSRCGGWLRPRCISGNWRT